MTIAEKLKAPGVKKGLEQGLKQGIEQGIEQGEKRANRRLVEKLLKQGFDIATIVELTNVNEKSVKAIQKNPSL